MFPVAAVDEALARTNRQSLAVLNERFRVREAAIMEEAAMEPLPVAREPRADKPAVARRGSALRRAATFRDGGAQVTEAAADASRERATAWHLPAGHADAGLGNECDSRASRPVRRAD